MIVPTPIFADDSSIWSRPLEMIAALTTIAGTVIGGIVWLSRRYIRLVRERDRYQRDLRSAEQELKNLQNTHGPARDELEQRLAGSKNEVEELYEELAKTREGAIRLQKIFDNLNRNLQIARQMEGLIWRAKPSGTAPKFTPLSQRHVSIMAVLNLKGGVGKTTLSANLGAAFARMGWRVLVVDLDLQASLSSLFVTGEQLQQFSQSQRLVQDYFQQSVAGSNPSFADYVHETQESGVELMGSSDTLAYAELNLAVHWLLRPGKKDVRLLLRGALHDSTCAERFDLVIIDCPPLLNVSCVNALAAADFLLVPVMPSKGTTDRVRPMMGWLHSLRQNLNPDLKIIGVAANRTSRSTGLTDDEKTLWAALRDQCHDSWGEKVHMCQAFIPQKVEVRDAENERRPLKPSDEIFTFFKKLATELAGRLPQSSRPASLAVTAKGKSS